MTDEIVLVPKSALVEVLEAAESYEDKGPPGQGWQSDELEAACKLVRASLKTED